MKLKRRILLSSTIMMLLALLMLLLVGNGVLRISSDKMDRPASTRLDDKFFEMEHVLEEFNAETQNWTELDEKLRAFQYRLCVLQGETILFSSLPQPADGPQPEHRMEWLAGMHWEENHVQAFVDQDITILGKEQNGIRMIALRAIPPDTWHNQFVKIRYQFFLIGLAAILIILAVGQIFTQRLARGILHPIDELIQGARRVEKGNLTQPVYYDGTDEFAAVCNAFNDMQCHLKEEKEKNAAYEQARTDMVAGISHDLRTPLTSVKGYIKGLRDGVANTAEKQQQYLSIAYQKACEMDVLLQQLFYFSKLETGNLLLLPEKADLGAFVQAFVRSSQQELRPQEANMTEEVTPGGHPVWLDREQMHRVLANLTENSLKHAKIRPLTLHISVWKENDREWLRFADNGNGAAEEELPHLLEQFWRGDRSRGSRNGEGSGLGLYIVKRIVEAHSGTITVKNDNGLVVEISLPCRKDDESEQNINCGR